MSTGWREWVVAGALSAAFAFVSARADTVLSIPTVTGADVTIKVSSPLLQPPRFGFVPIRVTIENSAPRERSWQLQFQSGVRGQYPGVLTYDRSFTVPAGQTRETWVYVPIAEPGEQGKAPSFVAGGLPSSTPGSATPSWSSVSITKTAAGTHIARTRTAGPAVLAVEEVDIDETTGELTRNFKSGSLPSITSSRPPGTNDILYMIDSSTGEVTTRLLRRSAGGKRRVTVVQSASGGGNVLINKTPLGTKVARLGPRGNILEEREIDATTGVITTTINGRTSLSNPPPQGMDVTYTIDTRTGSIQTSMTSSGNPGATPKITIQTRNVGGPGIVRSGRGSSGPPMMLSVEVLGPGVSLNNRVQFPTLSNDENMRPIAATARVEGLLTDVLKASRVTTPNVASVDPAQLPADWRVWSPFATVVMTVDDYALLDVARRSALRGWLTSGGRLCLVPGEEGEAKRIRCGAGEILYLAQPLKADMTAKDLELAGLGFGGTAGHPDRDELQVVSGSDLSIGAQRPEPSTVWVGIFLVVFGVVVGPVNLFVLAPAKKRHRLFLTTPLISLAAVAVLGLAIFVQDGIGGDGWRRALVVFVPGDNQAVVIQEQSARTGFLTRRAFRLSDDTLCAMLPLDGPNYNPMQAYSALDLARADDRVTGGWFRSRQRQAHLLQRVVPTRGRVELVGTPGGAPIVQSSIGSTLLDFVYVDENGSWFAPQVAPGQRVTLSRGGAWITNRGLGGTMRFSSLLTAAAPKEPGHWGARASAGELAPVETLSAIAWQNADAVLVGVIENAAPAKEVKP